jgi:6-phosphogluconolactonase
MARLLEFASRTEASEALALRVAEALRRAAQDTGAASIVLSGGESPRGLLRALRAMPLPWERVSILPSDERWIATDDPASNEGMIKAELLSGPPAAAAFIGLYRDAQSPEEALPALAAAIDGVPRPFAAVVLGMGDDGHTASLFPDSPDIEQALASRQPVVVQRLARLPHARVSLSLRTLLDASGAFLLLFGGDKRAVYERAGEPGPAAELPVRALLHQSRVPVTAYWAP